MTVYNPLPDAVRVARSFGRAAGHYDRHARFQRDVADQLTARVGNIAVEDILDLGSGTGYCAKRLQPHNPDASFTSLDLSEAMLAHAREIETGKPKYRVCGDAQSLPFRDDTFDLVVSSLTLQWCPSPEHCFTEVHRILKPGGKAWVSTLAEHTLEELRVSWAAVDDYVHVNSFLTLTEIKAAAGSAPFPSITLENRQVRYYYDSLGALAKELKGIGANNLNAGQASGLTGKRKLQKLKSAFEKHHIQGKGIPVTYDLVLIALQKA
jgi:malonyl-CoA O-methyltransferase